MPVFEMTEDSLAAQLVVMEGDKIGSATSPLGLQRTMLVSRPTEKPLALRVGDVLVTRAVDTTATYNQLELASGRLAKINPGDVIVGVAGSRRALKGFVGDAPKTISAGDELHLLNMGGVIGRCTGHHSSFGGAIRLSFIGCACDEHGRVLNIADNAIRPTRQLTATAPVVLVVGASMNSGKTLAATELIRQATRAGLRVAAGKLSGIACLRDTLNMSDHGAVSTASFLDCGLPSTADISDLAPVAKAIVARLNESTPDLLVLELGDGILGGYSVASILEDVELTSAIRVIVFCASDYVGAWGGVELLRRRGLTVDVIAGSVTDSQMGEDFIEREFSVPAKNAQRHGLELFEIVRSRLQSKDLPALTSQSRS